MNTWKRVTVVAVMIVSSWAAGGAAKEDAHPGVLAASVGDQVILADPLGGWVKAFATGPVGRLYPAPGGVLYAPDVVHGQTTVLDLRRLREEDRLDGLTLPWFGEVSHRYLVILPGEVLVTSYPDRALIARIEADIVSPWQAVIAADDTNVLILDRTAAGGEGAALVAIDLISRRQVYRRALDGDVRYIALSDTLGVLAVADASGQTVRIVDPASMSVLLELPMPEPIRDVCFLGEGEVVAAVSGADGRGSVATWKLKLGTKGLQPGHERMSPIHGEPIRVSPSADGQRLAVALAEQKVVVFGGHKLEQVAVIEIGGVARDLVWCDPAAEGPLGPEWSDQAPPELTIGRLPPPKP
jgi:hypothetical protein